MGSKTNRWSHSPNVDMSPANSMKARFFCEIVKDALSEYAYDAEIAGLQYDLRSGPTGFVLSIGGYNDKMTVLLEKVLDKMKNTEIKPDRFKVIKDYLTRWYKNWELSSPYQQIRTFSKYLSVEKCWLVEEQLDELANMTIEDLESFIPEIFKQVHIEVLAHGNLYKEDALRLSDQVVAFLDPKPLPHAQLPLRRNFIIPPGSKYFYPRLLKDKDNVNSCIEYHLFIGEIVDRRLRACVGMFSQITEE